MDKQILPFGFSLPLSTRKSLHSLLPHRGWRGEFNNKALVPPSSVIFTPGLHFCEQASCLWESGLFHRAVESHVKQGLKAADKGKLRNVASGDSSEAVRGLIFPCLLAASTHRADSWVWYHPIRRHVINSLRQAELTPLSAMCRGGPTKRSWQLNHYLS